MQQAGQVCPRIRFLSVWCQSGFTGLFRGGTVESESFLVLTHFSCKAECSPWLFGQSSVVRPILMVRRLPSTAYTRCLHYHEVSLFSCNSSMLFSFVRGHWFDDCFVWSCKIKVVSKLHTISSITLQMKVYIPSITFICCVCAVKDKNAGLLYYHRVNVHGINIQTWSNISIHLPNKEVSGCLAAWGSPCSLDRLILSAVWVDPIGNLTTRGPFDMTLIPC